jgi:nucleoside-diphosphate-sugar epimerase
MGQALNNLINYAGSTSQVIGISAKLAVPVLGFFDRIGVSPLAPWHYLTFDKSFYFDMSKLESLGWQSQYSNDRMLAESYDWYLENRNLKTSGVLSPHRKKVSEGVLSLLRYFN